MAQTSYHKWDKAHPEKAREYRARYNEAHPDKVRASKKKYRLSHPGETQRDKKKWNETHPDYMPRYLRKWIRDHPEQVKQFAHRYRAHKEGNGGSYTIEELDSVFESQEGFCYLCGELLYGKLDDLPEVEHKIPISRGGTNDISNIGLAHMRCNRRKHAKTDKEFLID